MSDTDSQRWWGNEEEVIDVIRNESGFYSGLIRLQ